MSARGIAAALALIAAVPISAQRVVPPAGHSGGGPPPPGVAADPEPGTPALTRLSDAAVQSRFRIDPAYPRAGVARVKVVGAFAVAEPPGERIVAAWSAGFMPVTLKREDGRCLTLSADYEGGKLSGGRLASSVCGARPKDFGPPPPAAPAGQRVLGNPWGFGAWVDGATGTTTIGAPAAKVYTPLVRARMASLGVMAMNGPDSPGANLTFVGRIGGRLAVVTVELSY